MLPLSVLNVGDDSGPSLSNIAKLIQNTESRLGTAKDITDQRFTAHKYQGPVACSARQEKAKIILILLVTCLSLTGQCSCWSRPQKTFKD